MMVEFIRGMIAMASFTAGLFFLRFWWRTNDRFFLLFSAAFAVLGLTRLGRAVLETASEHHTTVLLFRLAAFLIILIAIIDKNWMRPARTD